MQVRLLFATILLILNTAMLASVGNAVHTPLCQNVSDLQLSDSGTTETSFLTMSTTPTPTPTPPPPPPPPVRGPNPGDRGGAPTAFGSTFDVRTIVEQSARAARVFRQIMENPERSIPQDLLNRADAVVVFPGALNSGFADGHRGSGVMSRRVPGGWSVPAFFEIAGGSIGLQIHVSSSDYVLLVMNTDTVEMLVKEVFEIGGEGTAAAGPVGRSASASTDARLNAQILSYSRSKGEFAGLELKGVVIKPNDTQNMKVYGMTARDLLASANNISFAKMPQGLRAFPETLSRYSTRR